MASIRLDKISRLLQKELAIFFQQESKSIAPGTMISVTVVRISPDLSIAKAYLSIFPSAGAQQVVDKIIEIKSRIRGEIGTKIKKQLRIIPELHFHLDDSLDYIENINNLLKS